MPVWYWAMIWFSVLCMLAAPVCYRLLYRQKAVVPPGRWRLYTWMCVLLFCLGLVLMVALGLIYPKQNPIYGSAWDSGNPFRGA